MKVIGFVMCMLAATCVVKAQDTIAIRNARLTRVEDSVQLTMSIDLKKSPVGKHEIVLIEPIMHSPNATCAPMPSVGIYGKIPYYYYLRSGDNWLQTSEDVILKASKVGQNFDYVATLPYESWMDTASVSITISSNHYCEGAIALTGYDVYTATPQVRKGAPQTNFRLETLSGSAHVDYVVNRTEINPNYHNNARELENIRQSIDSVRTDPHNDLREITIKGYASPEGPYKNNERLAKGRSESLTRHIADQYNIPRALMRTDYQPEDWEGLRDSVQLSQLPHRQEILDIIDDTSFDYDLDLKLRRIQTRYPKDYQYILRHYMPYLRHTDYTISYDRRPHTAALATVNDTIWSLPHSEQQQGNMPHIRPFRPFMALKTNLLFDAVAALNFEVEIPLGKKRDWSIMVEDWFPWYLLHRNHAGDTNPYRRNDQKAYRSAYQVWNVGVEIRKWFHLCRGQHPLMTGHFLALYAATGKYDIEWKGVGDQGEYQSYGLTWGYAWLIGKRWNMEFSVSGGVLWGPQRHYTGEYDDSRLIWRENRNFFYAGPTKLKLSLVWLIGNTLRKAQKGGER